LGLFRRRRETLNEQLLREAGIAPAEVLGDRQPPLPHEPPKSVLEIVGVPDGSRVSPKEWDATVTAEVPGLAGNRIDFTTLAGGDVIVSEETGDADLSPLADAVERSVNPPYRASAVRQDGDLWAIGAKRIQVAQISFPGAERLELSQHGDLTELRVDSEPSDTPVPLELQRLGDKTGDDFYVEAERIDGDLWEVKVTAL